MRSTSHAVAVVAVAFIAAANTVALETGAHGQSGLADLTVVAIDGTTRTPVPDVLITVGIPASAPLSLTTSSDGRVRFPATPTGWYSLLATGRGWLPSGFRQQRPLGSIDQLDLTSPGSHTAEVLMWRSSSLQGSVVDDAGLAVPFAMVLIGFQNVRQPNDWTIYLDRTADKDGHFQFLDIAPQKYLVAAASGSTSGSPTFSLTFSPHARVAGDADLVDLRSGDAFSVTIEVPRRRTQSVSGVVLGADAIAAGVSLRLLPVVNGETGDETFALKTRPNESGAFQFQYVPPGDYVVQIVDDSDEWWGSTPVTVSETEPVRNVSLSSRLGSFVSGRIETAEPLHVSPPDSATPTVILFSPLDHWGPTYGIDVQPGGAFRAGPFVPGRYQILVDQRFDTGPVRVDGRLVPGRTVRLESNDLSGVTVEASPKIESRLAGSARDISRGCGGRTCRVAIFPADERLWSIPGGRWPIPVELAGSSEFSFGWLQVGDYYAIVTEPRYVEEWPSPHVLKALVPFATRVSVKHGETTRVELVYRPH